MLDSHKCEINVFLPIKVIISAQERTRAMAARWRFNKTWKNLRHNRLCHLHTLNAVDLHRNNIPISSWRTNLMHSELCHLFLGDIENSFVIIPTSWTTSPSCWHQQCPRIINKLQATLPIRNYNSPTYLLTGVWCRGTSVAKSHIFKVYYNQGP